MTVLLNILWLVFGGLIMAAGWFLVTLLLAISIIGIPWARACFNIAVFALWPFGRAAIARDELYGREDLGTGPAGTLGNIIWLVVAGIWLAIGHVTAAIASALTIIGIPFAIQHLKLAAISLWPIGMTIVPSDVARVARWRGAAQRYDALRP